MRKVLLVIALGFTVTSAYAKDNDGGTTCNGNGSCGTTNNTTNQGGAGGNGYGGIGVGVGIAGASATGGNATGGSSNVDVRNTNTNANTNVNANTSVNTNANVQGQIQGQGQKQSTNNANNSTNSVVVEGDNFEARRIPVNTAFAPSIPATATCTLSISGGVSVIGFSGSFGHAYVDKNCEKLERVRNVALVLGDIATAEALQCQDKDYAKARLTIGRPCPVEQE